MSEEGEEYTQDNAPAPSPADDSASAPEATLDTPQTTDSKPPGYAPVDPATASPEEVKQRLDYLYRQVKTDQRERQEWKRLAADQSRVIEQLQSGMGAVVNHLQDKSTSETEAQLKQTMRAAYENGDTAAYLDAQDKLDDLRLEKKLAEKQKKAAPAAPAVKAQQQQTEDNEGGYISPEDQAVVDSWQDEKDEGGSLLRPWAHNRSGDPNRPDPAYMAALAETYAVMNSPRFANATMEQKMAEVDKRMGVSKTAAKQTVLGGGLTGARKTSKVALSPEMEKIAIRTKFGGSKAKTDAEHIAAYRQQVERVQQRKGARQ